MSLEEWRQSAHVSSVDCWARRRTLQSLWCISSIKPDWGYFPRCRTLPLGGYSFPICRFLYQITAKIHNIISTQGLGTCSKHCENCLVLLQHIAELFCSSLSQIFSLVRYYMWHADCILTSFAVSVFGSIVSTGLRSIFKLEAKKPYHESIRRISSKITPVERLKSCLCRMHYNWFILYSTLSTDIYHSLIHSSK